MVIGGIDVNWIVVLAGGIVSMVVGSLWYSPILFAKPWMAAMGYSEAKIAEMKQKCGSMGKTYAIAFVNALVMSFVFTYVMSAVGALSLGEALGTAFLIWVGFVVTLMVGGLLWEGKPLKLLIINAGNYLVVLAILAVIWFYLP